MTTRVLESAVVDAPIDSVWNCVRNLDFKFLSSVENAENEERAETCSCCAQGESCSCCNGQVGSVVKITYKDGTTQRLKRLELSDLQRFVTWEVIESTPAVPYLSTLSTISLKSVSASGQTFVEWHSDFSADAGQDVIQDAKFKRLDAFKDLASRVSLKK
jgi:hypothetical protein